MKRQRASIVVSGSQDLETLVRSYRPLVASLCRKYLPGVDSDVDDAIQETFLRLLSGGQAASIESMSAWLSRVARTVCLDQIRRRQAEQRRVGHKAANVASAEDPPQAARARARREILTAMLPRSMKLLTESDRKLLADRFIHDVPLRVIAARQDQSIATISRNVARAVQALSEAFEELGVSGVDPQLLTEHLSDDAYVASLAFIQPDPTLRLMPDRRGVESRLRRVFGEDVPTSAPLPTPPQVLWPGWNRPIRVGVMVHYHTMLATGYRGSTCTGEYQVQATTLLADPRFELVAMVEPQTADKAPVERTIRDFEIYGGLIEAHDVEALSTLDVIFLGLNFVVTDQVLEAIHRAVSQDGVGFYKDGWLAVCQNDRLSPIGRELLLAASPIFARHMPSVCGDQAESIVCDHSGLHGLSAGTRFLCSGCGPAYVPARDATLHMKIMHVVPPQEHGLRNVGPLPMPLLLSGSIGRGRAVVSTSVNLALRIPILHSSYLPNLMAWLAEPRRTGELA